MITYHVTSARTLSVPAGQAYALIANYHTGHPRIVPPQYFRDMVVEQGGVGAGTVIRFTMRVLGKTQQFRARISEPEPGRVLVESNEGARSVTTFVVEPLPGGQQSNVTITTEFAQRPGIAGRIERVVTGLVLKRIYALELARIETVARESSDNTPLASRAA